MEMSPRPSIFAWVLTIAASGVALAPAGEMGYSLDGDLLYAYQTYGVTVPTPGQFSARLVYSLESEPIYNLGNCDCASYHQQIFNGFSIAFDGLVVRADEYMMEITNDFAPDGGSDFVRIVFSSALTTIEAPLTVNGVARQSGVLILHLKDSDGTALQDNSLPQQLNLADFESKFLFLKDSPADSAFEIAGELTQIRSLATVSGDYDFDGAVDGADFLIWQRSVGMQGISAADGDRDKAVGPGDLAVWMDHFGSAESAPAATTVAEPSGARLGVLVALLACVVRIHSIRHSWRAQ